MTRAAPAPIIAITTPMLQTPSLGAAPIAIPPIAASAVALAVDISIPLMPLISMPDSIAIPDIEVAVGMDIPAMLPDMPEEEVSR